MQDLVDTLTLSMVTLCSAAPDNGDVLCLKFDRWLFEVRRHKATAYHKDGLRVIITVDYDTMAVTYTFEADYAVSASDHVPEARLRDLVGVLADIIASANVPRVGVLVH